MIAIHAGKGSFSDRWIDYCVKNNIKFKIVDCYQSDIVERLSDCDALMWHHNHMNPKDILVAKQLLFSLEQSGKIVFPDFYSNWHFDDKVGQKYLLESLKIPFVPTFVSFDKIEALEWAKNADFPKVFKLRRGGGSWNVFLVKNQFQARKIINKAFRTGFKQYNAITNIKERWYKYKMGKDSLIDVIKGFVRIFNEPLYSRVIGRDFGYVYFQDFIPGNDFDIRVIVTGKKAFAIKRFVRKNDFRASGSGVIRYEKNNFPESTIQIAFEIAQKLDSQSISIDFVYENQIPLVVEISYGFVHKVYDACVGYWDENMNWYDGKFDPCEWMVELVRKKIIDRKSASF